MLTVTEVVPLAEDVLLLLGLHHVLLLQTLQGEHAGRVRLAVAVLDGEFGENFGNVLFRICDFYLYKLYSAESSNTES